MVRIQHIGQRAFTLLEALVAITIIAVLASVVAPAFTDDSRLRVMAAAELLRSDIELAEVMTLSFPQDPVVIRFDAGAPGKYWLALASTPETPITHQATHSPYVVEFGTGRASAAVGVTLDSTGVTGGVMQFDAHGGLANFTTSPVLALQHGQSQITLTIAPNTGTVTEASAESPAAKAEGVKVKK